MNYQRQTTCVFPSPSKIPYGGFSPVRLQTEIPPPPSTTSPESSAARIPPAKQSYRRPKSTHPALAAHRRANRVTAGCTRPSGTIPGSKGRFRPEALGSSAGSSVPPDHRLLWPHPSLSLSSTHLCIRGWLLRPRGLPRAENERFPNLLPVSGPSCRPPYPDGPDGCLWLCFAIRSGLRRFRSGSASIVPTHVGSGVGRVTRLQGSLYATAQRLARPSPTRTITLELSRVGSLHAHVEYNYAGKQPIPAAGLSPARNKALWAANGRHGIRNHVSLIPVESREILKNID